MTGNRHLAILFAVTWAVVFVAGWAAIDRRAMIVDEVPSARMFPDLGSQFAAISEVRISWAAGSAFKTATLSRQAETWIVRERDGYPVDQNLLRRLLVSLDQLTVIEAKTRDPARFKRIDLRDLSIAGSRAGQVTVLGPTGEPVFDALIGKRRANPAGGPARMYLRKAAENQSWLAEGDLDLRAGPADWLNREITNIAVDEIVEAALIDGQGDRLTVVRDENLVTKFRFQEIADDVTLTSEFLPKNSAAVLEFNVFNDVRSATGLRFQPALGSAIYKTKEGLQVTVDFARDDQRRTAEGAPVEWARFRFRSLEDASPAAKTQAENLTKRTDGWAYLLPAVRMERLRQTPASVAMPAKSG